MTIEALEKNAEVLYQSTFNNPYVEEITRTEVKEYGKKLSIEFAISTLALLISMQEDDFDRGKGKYILNYKIQELKTYLNAK